VIQAATQTTRFAIPSQTHQLIVMTNDFSDRVILVTGAARGFGRATAVRFLASGARVGVNVRTQERAERLAHELGDGAFPVGGDIRDASTVRALVEKTRERLAVWMCS
jgi:NAD(P)-dependent dehydrogenase (short-subunit alcohol dehydrogenase family)